MSTDANTPEMQQALLSLLKLAGMEPAGNAVTSREVELAVEKIKSLVIQLGASRGSGGGSPSSHSPSTSAAGSQLGSLSVDEGVKNILIAGQLGIITHQLRQNLTKIGATVTIANDMDEAVNEYKNQDFNIVIVDLFMPTEREGMIVLDEIRRTSMLCNIQTHVIVLGPPTKDKNIPDRCRAHGASVFLEKAEGWHKIILQYVNGELDITKEPSSNA